MNSICQTASTNSLCINNSINANSVQVKIADSKNEKVAMETKTLKNESRWLFTKVLINFLTFFVNFFLYLYTLGSEKLSIKN